jgi:hypothetical protein
LHSGGTSTSTCTGTGTTTSTSTEHRTPTPNISTRTTTHTGSRMHDPEPMTVHDKKYEYRYVPILHPCDDLYTTTGTATPTVCLLSLEGD